MSRKQEATPLHAQKLMHIYTRYRLFGNKEKQEQESKWTGGCCILQTLSKELSTIARA